MAEIKMSIKDFTEKEIEILSRNCYIKAVSKKSITYTDEFKRIFIASYENGKQPKVIFEENGFDTDIIGMERVKSSSRRWRIAYKKDGIDGLCDTRKLTSGRPINNELSIEEKYARLQAQNNFLKAENELLKKIDMMERRLLRGK